MRSRCIALGARRRIYTPSPRNDVQEMGQLNPIILTRIRRAFRQQEHTSTTALSEALGPDMNQSVVAPAKRY